jgi:hypothetical protein
LAVDLVDGDQVGRRAVDGGRAVTDRFGLDLGVPEAAVIHDGNR